MKTIGIFLLVMMNTVMLSGCWDRMEINDLAIVTAVGIDKTEKGEICLSLLIPTPKRLAGSSGGNGGGGSGGGGNGGGEDTAPTILISECGEGIVDAFRKLQGKSSREIMFSHVRLIVIGERLAKDGVADVLDFFSRYRQSNLRAHILFSTNNIDEVLESDPGIEQTVSELIREEGEEGVGIRTDLKDFIRMLTEEGINPIAGQIVMLPLLAKHDDNAAREKPKEEKSFSSVRGAAVFRKDVLAGWISDAETRGILWLRGEIKEGAGGITVDIPEDKGGGKIAARVRGARTKLQPDIHDGKLSIAVSIEAQVVIYESSSKIDLSDPKSIYYIEKLLADDINEKIAIALEKTQKQLQCDVVGFGNAVYRKYPAEWRNQYKESWPEYYPGLDIQVASKVWIPRVGFVTNSLVRQEDK
ncbi:hypothetical protein P22_2598 [Propionispora sp. 2/2-37]|uniref:Ger(x)C family spore germination protein n=1 Tax=Propionispora sp. 2/2-37 TaxID=1677858 RepID=UPI0006BB595B|nr:Ger(x)C family spore germination protein [Propionispora sp. 2/2-37]CUH96508.1 hypothetical protein P22_2598 [Propionispora sp. 2/2-37]